MKTATVGLLVMSGLLFAAGCNPISSLTDTSSQTANIQVDTDGLPTQTFSSPRFN